LFSFLFATQGSFYNALILCQSSLCILIHLKIETLFYMRYFPASIRFVYFFTSNVKELLKRVSFLWQFYLYSYLYANSDIVQNALFLRLNSICMPFICNVRELPKCIFSLPEVSLFSFLFLVSEIVQNALFLSLKLICILHNLQHKRATKTR